MTLARRIWAAIAVRWADDAGGEAEAALDTWLGD